MKTYNRNGTETDISHILSEEDDFAIQIYEKTGRQELFYKNDSLVRDVENEIVNFYNIFCDMYFTSRNDYYAIQNKFPLYLQYGGFSSDYVISLDEFKELYSTYEHKNFDLNRYIYLSDCQYLLSTLQNLIQQIEFCFTQYYIKISNKNLGNISICEKDGTFYTQSDLVTNIAFLVESFFIKCHSVLDILVKIIYELEYPMTDFSSMKKLVSKDKIWGDRKKLGIFALQKGVFENCELIKTLETIRNECIHNGSWEDFPKVFIEIKDNQIVERYMLFPDLSNGYFCSIKNRKHFFSTRLKVNDVLIKIHDEFYFRLLATLKDIRKYACSNILCKKSSEMEM